MRLILVAAATNVISEPFPWLVLNRTRKTCLALQCIRVVVYSTVFLIKGILFSKTVYGNPAEMSFQKTFDVIIIIIVHLLTINKGSFDIIWTKKAN